MKHKKMSLELLQLGCEIKGRIYTCKMSLQELSRSFEGSLDMLCGAMKGICEGEERNEQKGIWV